MMKEIMQVAGIILVIFMFIAGLALGCGMLTLFLLNISYISLFSTLCLGTFVFVFGSCFVTIFYSITPIVLDVIHESWYASQHDKE